MDKSVFSCKKRLSEVLDNRAYTVSFSRVKLRHLEFSDIEMLRMWRNNPHNCTFLRRVDYITVKKQRGWFQKYVKQKKMVIFAIEDMELNCIVGSLALYHFVGFDAEFGKILIGDERAHGKGIGFFATKAALEVCFTTLALESVVLNVSPSNKRAVCTFEKAGFKHTNETTYQNGWLEEIMRIDRVDYYSEKINK